MKTLLVLLALCAPASARNVFLVWEPEHIGTVYTVYLHEGDSATIIGSTTETQIALADFPDGESTIWITASNQYEESAPTEIVIAARPSPPSGVIQKKLKVQSSPDTVEWTTFTTLEMPNPELQMQFFRLEIEF